jgi:polysaccharide biosynthesis protein PslG
MRSRAALVLGALLAVVALLPGCGGNGGDDDGEAGGEAKVNDPFYGVISAEPLPDGATLARLGRAGVGTLRVNLAWGSVQSGPDAPYDWSHYDPVVENAARNGIRVLATVYSSPSWAESSPEVPPLGRSLRGFEAFVRAAVERYGAQGSFWSERPDVPELPIADWQLWNEPNFAPFWKPAPDPAAYLELLRAFDSAVERNDPTARTITGGLFPTPAGGPSAEEFLADVYREGGAELFDAVGVHPYAATPGEALSALGELRALMSRFGDSGKPIWITEVGWASGGAPSGLTVGAARQADYLTQIFDLAAADRDRLGIAGVVWYSLSDTPGPLWVGHCGMFRLDGSAKPSWEAFASVAGGAT